MSSLEEDTELRDLVANTLQTCGVLGKIKAQLRSNVYLALDGGEHQLKTKSTLTNQLLSNFTKTTEGRLVMNLIRELLTFLNLDCTLSVFDAEAIEGRGLQLRSRDDLIDKLGLVNERLGERHGSHAFDKVPLLSEVLRLSKVTILKSETPSPTDISHRTEEESSLRSSAIDETGTAKSSLTLGLGARNSNAYGMNNINQGLYGLSDRSNPGSIATTPPQSLTPESSLNPTYPGKQQIAVSSNATSSSHQSGMGNGQNPTSFTSQTLNSGTHEQHKKVPIKELQGTLSGPPIDSNVKSATQQFATSKGSSTTSSFSSIDHSLPERNQSKGVFSTQSSLGDLPPLGGAITSNTRNALAPIKKNQSSGLKKSTEGNQTKERKANAIHDLYANLDKPDASNIQTKPKSQKSQKHGIDDRKPLRSTTATIGHEKFGQEGELPKNTKGPLGSKSNSFSRTNSNLSDDPIIGKDEKLDSNDDDIEEDIDNFLDSQASADDFTKDETVASGEDASINADFVLDLRG